MQIAPFKLERYFAEHEFSTKYLLCTSDCQGLGMSWLLEQADEESLELWQNLTLGYTESLGHPLLRERIAHIYHSYHGVRQTEPSDVLVVSGPEEGIFIILNSLVGSGDHIITTWPAYQPLHEIANAIGSEVTLWPLREEQQWEPDEEFLKRNIKENTKLLVVNFPHNPTGFLPDEGSWQRIAEIAKAYNLYILSDEVYRGLEYAAGTELPSIIEIYERGITLSGMSKTYALAGLRIGWVVTHDTELFEKIASFKDYTTICCSAPAEILAIIALEVGGKIMRRNLNIINKNLKLFRDYLDDFEGEIFTWTLPKAGSVFFPKLLGGSVEEFCEDLRRKEGVLLLPGSVYDYPGNNFRVGLGRLDFEVGVARLYKYLVRYLR